MPKLGKLEFLCVVVFSVTIILVIVWPSVHESGAGQLVFDMFDLTTSNGSSVEFIQNLCDVAIGYISLLPKH